MSTSYSTPLARKHTGKMRSPLATTPSTINTDNPPYIDRSPRKASIAASTETSCKTTPEQESGVVMPSTETPCKTTPEQESGVVMDEGLASAKEEVLGDDEERSMEEKEKKKTTIHPFFCKYTVISILHSC